MLPLLDDRFYQLLDGEAARRDAEAICTSPAVFRDNLLIDVGDGRHVPLGHVPESWQASDFAALDPGWQSIVTGTGNAKFYRGYLERPRGHSKTTDIAAMASWALYSSRRQLRGVAAAGSKDQAKLLRDAIDSLARLNPWLGAVLKIHNYVATNPATGSTLTILASDEATSYGKTPDFVILDELTHWKDQRLWTSLFSSIAKRPRCMLVIIANAGWGMNVSWQWRIRELARTEPGWYFHRLDGPTARWITEAHLAEQRKGLPPKEYARLWMNLWQTSGGDALDMDLVYRACVLAGPVFQQTLGGAVAGLDLAQTHDHAAFIILGLDIHRRKILLQYAKRWKPHDFPDGRISIKTVETAVIENCKRLQVLGVAYDPYQCERTAEELRANHIPTFRYDFTPKNCMEMATTILEVFNTGQAELYREESLLTDFAKLNIVARAMGFKLEAPSDEATGHADLGTAYAIALPWAVGTLASFADVA